MESFYGLLNNAAFMLILVSFMTHLACGAIPKKNLRDCLTGTLVGLIVISVMLTPGSLHPGVFFDIDEFLSACAGSFWANPNGSCGNHLRCVPALPRRSWWNSRGYSLIVVTAG